MSQNTPSDNGRSQLPFNTALAAVLGQVGCLTVAIILLALFGGLWLDGFFHTRPTFTIILTLASIPVTLILMYWVVVTATARYQKKSSETQRPEEG
jgi:F0F1-type ATP synthase assembly protein I